LTVVVSVDEHVVSSLGKTTRLGNAIALQIRRPRIEGQAAADWAETAFESLCDQFSPVWGGGGHPAEYWAKVMTEQPPIRALGWDLGRFLPAVFWLNFFGRPYRQLIGEDRLGSTPASQVIPADQGFSSGSAWSRRVGTQQTTRPQSRRYVTTSESAFSSLKPSQTDPPSRLTGERAAPQDADQATGLPDQVL